MVDTNFQGNNEKVTLLIDSINLKVYLESYRVACVCMVYIYVHVSTVTIS